ncbi:MAG: chemotaxis-specific protein-glutamate methyltransferase CheB [Desulfobacteraceae bacterium]|nr:MAG: chemotaxis-specific protein-glutamate methyltransferase CheB [Desulfobacteraceae bacterium]
MEKLKVLIVDNSIFYRKILSRAVAETGLGQVAHTASNAVLALERLEQHETDVVLLDMSIPGMKCLETMEKIRKEHPAVFVVMLSAGSAKKTADTIMALEIGAWDFIPKPPALNAEKHVENIKNRLQGLFAQIMTRKYTSPAADVLTVAESAPAYRPAPKKQLSGVDLVVIASSTGGPAALEDIFKNLPAAFNKPVLVVQHMPAGLTKKLAFSLNKKCQLPVIEAAEGDPVKPGRVMIAPGGFHMTVQPGSNGDIIIKLASTPPVNGVRPAADVLFHSVAANCRGKRILAVILTGMGSDGLSGIEEMKKTCDCYCLTQSEKTCTVYGMPKNVVDAGLSDRTEDLNAIPARLLQIVSGRSLGS